jgi:hypothetical protein
MWYQLLFEGNHTGYAESTDGLHWTKPELDVISYDRNATNLVVSQFDPGRTGGVCHNPSVMRVLQPGDDPAQRYVLFGYDPAHSAPRAAYSADGIHWSYPAGDDNHKLFASSDVVNFAVDPYRQRYFATWKTKNRMGRAVGVAFSPDGRNWQKPIDGPVFGADDLDPDATQVYGMPAFCYQGLYIGLPWIYRARYFRYGEYRVEKLHEAQADSPRNMEVQLAWSWDLINWTRPPKREQFIPRGSDGAWDDGMIVTARAPVQVGDQLYFYFGGMDQVHDENQVQAGIGLATLRVDGFCSMRTAAENEGWLVSRREPMSEPGVWINARCEPGGSIRAELLDRKNRVISGFSRDDSEPFAGDAVRHQLRWRQQRFTDEQRRKDYKIRFLLDRAELYSYLPVTTDGRGSD